MQVDPSEPDGQDSDYRAKAQEARKQEDAQLQERIKQSKEESQKKRAEVNQQLEAWEAAVKIRDERRRNIGLMLAGGGVLAGILLLFWASRLQLGSFPEKILDGLGTAMLVAATVEAAVRLIRNLISTRQKKAEENRDAYLRRIRDDVITIASDLNRESIEREAIELDARDAKNAERKALWEDARDEIMALPSKSPEQEGILQSLNKMLEAIPAVPNSYYYSAKADLQFDKRVEERRRRLEGDKPDETSD